MYPASKNSQLSYSNGMHGNLDEYLRSVIYPFHITSGLGICTVPNSSYIQGMSKFKGVKSLMQTVHIGQLLNLNRPVLSWSSI